MPEQCLVVAAPWDMSCQVVYREPFPTVGYYHVVLISMSTCFRVVALQEPSSGHPWNLRQVCCCLLSTPLFPRRWPIVGQRVQMLG